MFPNTEVSFTSEDWKYIKDFIETAQRNATDKVTQLDCSETDSLIYRGRIALCKEILKLPALALMKLPAHPANTPRK